MSDNESSDPAAATFRGREHHHVPTPAENLALAQACRELIDAVVRTEASVAELSDVTAQVRALTARLSAEQMAEPRNLAAVRVGTLDDSGNPAVGRRNPIAPPLDVRIEGTDRVVCDFDLGAAYEGPPGCVHGGMVAEILDQALGTVPWLSGYPGMTAFLHVDYRRPTRLHERHVCTAWLERREGWKTWVRGEIRDSTGELTVEAEGLFITPRAARDRAALPQSD